MRQGVCMCVCVFVCVCVRACVCICVASELATVTLKLQAMIIPMAWHANLQPQQQTSNRLFARPVSVQLTFEASVPCLQALENRKPFLKFHFALCHGLCCNWCMALRMHQKRRWRMRLSCEAQLQLVSTLGPLWAVTESFLCPSRSSAQKKSNIMPCRESISFTALIIAQCQSDSTSSEVGIWKYLVAGGEVSLFCVWCGDPISTSIRLCAATDLPGALWVPSKAFPPNDLVCSVGVACSLRIESKWVQTS